MQGAKFKLYHDAVLRSVRVKWLLHELVGDDFEVEYVDTYRAEQYSARFLAINPNHAVPVLKITVHPHGGERGDGRAACRCLSPQRACSCAGWALPRAG